MLRSVRSEITTFGAVIAEMPKDEGQRLAELRSYALLDSLPEGEYEDLVTIAAQICGTPISLISLVDEERQWFKASYGVDGVTETHRDDAFCAHNILDPDSVMVVQDAQADVRFKDNNLVTGAPHIKFYAGVPLVSKGGFALGSLCVIDTVSRELSDAQLTALRALGRQVTKLFEARMERLQNEARLAQMELLKKRLLNFNHIIAHDLKAPLRNMRQLVDIILNDYQAELPADALPVLEMLRTASADANRLVQGVLRYSSSVNQLETDHRNVNLPKLIAGFSTLFGQVKPFRIEFVGPMECVFTLEVALRQVLQNLVGNAIKFCDKEMAVITIACRKEQDYLWVSVTDNGPGIPEMERKAIFSLFYTTAEKGEAQTESHGVGLSIVSELVTALGGDLSLESEEGLGSIFRFSIPSPSV